MSDIDLLKWLRELAQKPEFVERWPDYCPFTEAIDEIEKLQREHRNRGAAVVLAKEYLAEKDREIERLRALIEICPSILSGTSLVNFQRACNKFLKGGEDE